MSALHQQCITPPEHCASLVLPCRHARRAGCRRQRTKCVSSRWRSMCCRTFRPRWGEHLSSHMHVVATATAMLDMLLLHLRSHIACGDATSAHNTPHHLCLLVFPPSLSSLLVMSCRRCCCTPLCNEASSCCLSCRACCHSCDSRLKPSRHAVSGTRVRAQQSTTPAARVVVDALAVTSAHAAFIMVPAAVHVCALNPAKALQRGEALPLSVGRVR